MKPSPRIASIRGFVLIVLAVTGLIAACQTAPPMLAPTESRLVQPASTAAEPVVTPTQASKPTLTAAPLPTVPLVLESSMVEYSIPLHIQHKTQDVLVLMFELDQPIQGRVYWWPDDESYQTANSMAFDGFQTRHLLSLQGLAPGHTYQITVGLPGEDGIDRIPTFMGEFWGPLEITTLSEAIFPLTIGVFGDSGFGETLTRDLAAQLSSYAPDFIIHTGDLVYRADEQGGPEAAYQLKWYQTLSSLLEKTVIYPVVGNHEYDPDAILKGIPYYFSAFPMLDELQGGWQEAPAGAERQWYALEFGSLQMVFLNTQQLYGGSAREQQDVWLKSRLADPGFTATIVVFHVPPFTSGLHNLDGQAVISRWVSEFEASNVVLVLSGHDHNYERLERNGITYLVSGGGSSVLYPLQQRREESLRFDLKSHFVYLEVSAEELQIKVFDVEGTLFDSETIALHP